MKKIDKLILKNFKFFYGEELLNFENKNILLYGENGSGKSSIYWGLYTLLQSSLKKTDEEKTRLQDYFDKNNADNLRNRYMEDDDKSVIAIKLNDESKYIVSLDATNTNLNDTTIYEAYIASDFINYKLLAKNFDFKHREYLDIFEFLINNVLNDVFIEDKAMTFGKWWEKIASVYTPKGHVNKYNNIKELEADRTLFFIALQEYLASIAEDINTILKSNFKIDININLELEPWTVPVSKFRKVGTLDGKDKQQTTYYANAQLVNLHVEYDEHIKEENDKYINKPHSYLNEAKLTAIALSIRFAILRKKATADDILKILVLDDLLVSLDMSHREIVLNMIVEAEYLQDYQIIMLTHDKAFFEKAKRKFDYKQKGDWKYFELYVDDSAGFEKPFIKESSYYFDKAKELFKNKDYSECANTLRKEAEELLIRFLPEEEYKKKGGGRLLLQGLIDKARSYADNGKNDQKLKNILKNIDNVKDYEKFYNDINTIISNVSEDETNKERILEILHELEEFKNTILNPQSHHDIRSVLYKKEIEDGMKLIRDFKDLIEEG